mmetsp:Transcript_57438/g.179934  ORF Transcript_57438/g.179934 Transcript_57438/m.179934 type:complete len:223 (+) Transcript_57438:2-670(+)
MPYSSVSGVCPSPPSSYFASSCCQPADCSASSMSKRWVLITSLSGRSAKRGCGTMILADGFSFWSSARISSTVPSRFRRSTLLSRITFANSIWSSISCAMLRSSRSSSPSLLPSMLVMLSCARVSRLPSTSYTFSASTTVTRVSSRAKWESDFTSPTTASPGAPELASAFVPSCETVSASAAASLDSPVSSSSATAVISSTSMVNVCATGSGSEMPVDSITR